jgi:hypothetical protein
VEERRFIRAISISGDVGTAVLPLREFGRGGAFVPDDDTEIKRFVPKRFVPAIFVSELMTILVSTPAGVAEETTFVAFSGSVFCETELVSEIVTDGAVFVPAASAEIKTLVTSSADGFDEMELVTFAILDDARFVPVNLGTLFVPFVADAVAVIFVAAPPPAGLFVLDARVGNAGTVTPRSGFMRMKTPTS